MKKTILMSFVAGFMLVSFTGCLSWFYGSKKKANANSYDYSAQNQINPNANKKQTAQNASIKTYGNEYAKIYIDNADDCTKAGEQIHAFFDANEADILKSAESLVKSGKTSEEAFAMIFDISKDTEDKLGSVTEKCFSDKKFYSGIARMEELVSKLESMDASKAVNMNEVIIGEWTEQVSQGEPVRYKFMPDGKCTYSSVNGKYDCTYKLSSSGNEHKLSVTYDDGLDVTTDEHKVEYKDLILYIYTDNHPYKYRKD